MSHKSNINNYTYIHELKVKKSSPNSIKMLKNKSKTNLAKHKTKPKLKTLLILINYFYHLFLPIDRPALMISSTNNNLQAMIVLKKQIKHKTHTKI